MPSIRVPAVLLAAIIVASFIAAPSAHAQTTTTAPAPATSTKVRVESDSISVVAVQAAAEQLAVAVQEAVRKATEDPAVKLAALNVAKNAVAAAQIVVTQQAETLQDMLDALARELAQVGDRQKAKTKSH